MEDPGGLAGLRDLHQDLLALEASRLRNVERLWADLEARVNDFRRLLDKPAKNETSRKALSSGKKPRGSILLSLSLGRTDMKRLARDCYHR